LVKLLTDEIPQRLNIISTHAVRYPNREAKRCDWTREEFISVSLQTIRRGQRIKGLIDPSLGRGQQCVFLPAQFSLLEGEVWLTGGTLLTAVPDYIVNHAVASAAREVIPLLVTLKLCLVRKKREAFTNKLTRNKIKSVRTGGHVRLDANIS
jgi:hypothetical protein